MTLILNEIHVQDSLDNSFIIAAADSRITNPGGTFSRRQKLFEIPYLHGAISYFGLADFCPTVKSKSIKFSTWLPSFIEHHSEVESLEAFTSILRDELNQLVPSSYLLQYPSGFHICGFTNSGYPDFWSLSNIGKLENFHYSDYRGQYKPPANDFLGGDAKDKCGWDGIHPNSVNNGSVMIYRNGDFRTHAIASEALDKIYISLLQFPDFRKLSNLHDYQDFVKFKFEVIAYIYKIWCKKPIIGKPIDVLLLQK